MRHIRVKECLYSSEREEVTAEALARIKRGKKMVQSDCVRTALLMEGYEAHAAVCRVVSAERRGVMRPGFGMALLHGKMRQASSVFASVYFQDWVVGAPGRFIAFCPSCSMFRIFLKKGNHFSCGFLTEEYGKLTSR